MGGIIAPPPDLTDDEMRSVMEYDVTVDRVVRMLKRMEEQSKPGVLVMAGAGISVSAGIPDFRSPGTGLYDNLQKYDLPKPEAIFDIDYFKERPEAFCQLAKEMYPGNFKPTPTHLFIRLMQEKGVLKRCFTQNIDTLEREAGISTELLVEAHGSFAGAHCIDCSKEHSQAWVKDELCADRIPRCTCGGLVKPDIVFFGESLPQRFKECRDEDLPGTELLIVMGTSLSVHPFAGICNEPHSPHARMLGSDSQAPALTPRLLLNLEPVGERDESGHGFRFDTHDNYRDTGRSTLEFARLLACLPALLPMRQPTLAPPTLSAALLAACDDGVRALCDALGWRDELEALVRATGCANSQKPDKQPSSSQARQPRSNQASRPRSNQTTGRGGGRASRATGGRGRGVQASRLPGRGSGKAARQQATTSHSPPDEWTARFRHNWRKATQPPIPALRPLDLVGQAATPATATQGASGGPPKSWRLALAKPALEELQGGAYAYFQLAGLPAALLNGDKSSSMGRSRYQHCLALLPANATSIEQRRDRDFPFPDPNDWEDPDHKASPDNVRLKLPFLDKSDEEEQLRYPAQFEVWYYDKRSNEVWARWGPFQVDGNHPDDAPTQEPQQEQEA